ncbi:MAG: 16S rRNA processing protein RimM [Firmicutes bacterium]|nr:16S rRNA processing protein RimM [Bacillota bacterium]
MIKVATIINTRGLKGECKLYLVSEDAYDQFKKGKTVYLDQKTELVVKSFQIVKGLGYAKFEGIDTIEQAEAMKTKELWLPEEEMPELEEDEFYYYELKGCSVYNQNNENVGEVTEILETGANLVLRIANEDSSFLCPFVQQFVKEVDVKNKQIHIEEMEGLR